MTISLKPRMTADEFLSWAQGREGRWELRQSTPVAMSPERVQHAATKGAVYAALAAACRSLKLPCRAYPDGVAVRVDGGTIYEPDALVACGERPEPHALEISNPVIVVEVLSPGTASVDHGQKLKDYFKIPSVMHYLILDPESRLLVHHQRDAEDTVKTRILTRGDLSLAPPGLVVAVEELFPEP